MSELKPCPFCGGTNLYIDGYDHASGKRWRVVCLDCMATVDDGTVQQKYRAIEAWNRRAEPANEPLTLKQPEMVRCEDCKYFTDKGVCTFYSVFKNDGSYLLMQLMDDDDFCSYGERKESNEI